MLHNINPFPLVEKMHSSLEKNEMFAISFSGSLYAIVIDFDKSEKILLWIQPFF